jgi:hypothetical protein
LSIGNTVGGAALAFEQRMNFVVVVVVPSTGKDAAGGVIMVVVEPFRSMVVDGESDGERD